MVFYHKLWKKVEEKGITQNELAKRTGVSTATLTKMRKGEYVSLEVIDKIREELGCGFGDLITSEPPVEESTFRFPKNTRFEAMNEIIRNALQTYMQREGLTVSDVVNETGLSINTVKSFLSGKDISSMSFEKLCNLGCDFTGLINFAYDTPKISPSSKNMVYCDGHGNRRKKCWASQMIWNPETKSYDYYCGFDCKRCRDENNEFVALEPCPHPHNYKEMASAQEQYEFKYHGKVEFFPAKKGTEEK